MPDLIYLIPILLMPFLLALFLKLAAILFRRTKLRWSHALIFCCLMVVVGTVLGVVQWLLPMSIVTQLVVGGLGFALQLALAGWYLGSRAHTAEGAPIAFKGGVLLSLIQSLLIVALLLVVPFLFFGVDLWFRT